MIRTAIILLLLGICVQTRASDTVIFISDLNGRYGSTNYHHRVGEAVDYIIAQQPELVVIAGDMIAGQASPPLKAAQVQAMWQAFDAEVYQPLSAAGIPVAAAPGNHDASAYPAFSAERQAYADYWSTRPPTEGFSEGSNYPWYYGIDMPAVSLTFLDVTTTAKIDRAQQLFLERRRGDARARGAELVVTTHLPLHPISQGREREVFSITGTSLNGETWFSGHHHAFYPGETPTGALHISLPALGGNARLWIGSSLRSPFGLVSRRSSGFIVLHSWPGFEPSSATPFPTSIGNLHAVVFPLGSHRHSGAGL